MTVQSYPSLSIPSVSGQSGNLLSTDGSTLTWSSPSVNTAGITLLSTTSLSGASTVNISSIPQTYKQLKLIIQSPLVANVMGIRFNSDNTSNVYQTRTFGVNNSNTAVDIIINETYVQHSTSNYSDSKSVVVYDIFNYTSSVVHKNLSIYFYHATPQVTGFGTAAYRPATTAPITSINIIGNNVNFTAGTALLYGVN